MKFRTGIIICMGLILLLSACATSLPTETVEVSVERATDTIMVPTETMVEFTATEPDPTQTPVTPTETEPPQVIEIEKLVPLPPEPQRVEFQAEDGEPIVGIYYPAAINPAPLVVLHHWARGDKYNWLKNGMVQWLTNRGMSLDDLDMTVEDFEKLYPPMPEGSSFGVFIFDYRGFGDSQLENKWYPDGWRMDALAAVKMAKTLPGSDPGMVVSIGSSIGADGAVIGCVTGCLGAVSFSPGGYLGIGYAEGVSVLDLISAPVLCFASEGDGESAPTCQQPVGEFYEFVIYPGSDHGDELLIPGRDPEIGQLIQEFLFQVFQVK